jgi:hypothetical protein
MKVASGDVLPSYPYLWRDRRARGEEGGRKQRPVCVALAVAASDGRTHLALLAISGTPPRTEQQAIEVPALERRRIGIGHWREAWLYVSEYNYDVLEASFHLERVADAERRHVSPRFLHDILRAFRPTLAKGGARVDRR